MAWNEPGKNNDQDPWKNGDKNQGPPELDVILKKITDFFGKKPSNNSGNNQSNKGFNKGASNIAIAAGLAILVGIWFVSGWYTVKEAERGIVLRFGAYNSEVEPGLHWNPKFIDTIITVNVDAFRTTPTTGFMLTKDENVVKVEMEVQYRILEPKKYLFSVVNADQSLLEALDSALRFVVGHTTMDDVLTTGREVVRQQTWKMLEQIIEPYELGIEIVDVNLQQTRPPVQVQDAFDDAISAQEDEERFVREAEAYEREKEPIARGQVKRIEQQAEAYKQGVILKAQGEVARFNKLLPAYKANPTVTRQRLYIETMETVLNSSSKVLIDNKSGGNLTFLPLDKLMGKSIKSTQGDINNVDIISRSKADEKAGNDEKNAQSQISRGTRSTGRDY